MAGRLLLVGEANDDLNDLKVAFEAIGLSVETAPDGLAGLETGTEFQPDLVITEILTYRLSGFELAARIGSGVAGFAAPVIFYTEFYRDEKARREVLAKYGAIQYFVRPFQKEALKRAVVAHFQDFLSRLPAVPTADAAPEPTRSIPEGDGVVRQPSRAAAEKRPTHPVSGQPGQPGKPAGPADEGPAAPFRGFYPAGQTPASATAEPAVAQTLTNDEPEIQPVEEAAKTEVPRAETAPTSGKDPKLRERGLLLPVDGPSWMGRLLQSMPLRIAAVVIVAAVALYLARDQFRGLNQEVPSQQSETPGSAPPATLTMDTASQVAPPPAATISSPSPVQEPPAAIEVTEPAMSPAATASSTKDSDSQKTELVDSLEISPDRFPGLSIQDVSGSGRGPVLRKIKPIQLSPEMQSSLAGKAVVVRVVIDNAGKVTEVTPLNQEGTGVSLPADALADIRQWEFSRSRRKDAGEAVKYFSLKVQNPRQ